MTSTIELTPQPHKGDNTMEIRPIRSEKDYERALEEIELRFDSAPGSADADILDVLVTLVEDYEEQHYSIPLPDPVEAIKFRMEALGLTRKDLEPIIGGRSRVSEILNRRRPLSLDMVRSLDTALGIPAEVLIQPYGLDMPIGADWGFEWRGYVNYHGARYEITFVPDERGAEDLDLVFSLAPLESPNCYLAKSARSSASQAPYESIGRSFVMDANNLLIETEEGLLPPDWDSGIADCFGTEWQDRAQEALTLVEIAE